jgi:hypothetical protein
MAYDFNAGQQGSAVPKGKVSEFVVRIDDHPKYSGSKVGAQVTVQNALTQALKEGRAEPRVIVSQRTVDYDSGAVDEQEVTL